MADVEHRGGGATRSHWPMAAAATAGRKDALAPTVERGKKRRERSKSRVLTATGPPLLRSKPKCDSYYLRLILALGLGEYH